MTVIVLSILNRRQKPFHEITQSETAIVRRTTKQLKVHSLIDTELAPALAAKVLSLATVEGMARTNIL